MRLDHAYPLVDPAVVYRHAEEGPSGFLCDDSGTGYVWVLMLVEKLLVNIAYDMCLNYGANLLRYMSV